MVKVRFAPSPTGYIHIGNTRIALFNWLYSLSNKGCFVLRYDDTDFERSKQEYIDGIARDLDWLGIKPDEVHYQSKRFDRYNEVAEALKQQGLLYPCFETPQEIELKRKILLSRGLPPVYGRDSLRLTNEQKQDLIKQGRKPHWRFLLPNYLEDVFKLESVMVKWHDEVRGEQSIDLSSLSDPILIREDGTYLYTLPSVIDDIDMEITHIIRGDDHTTNTAVQIAIFKALKAKIPTFGHINLLTTASGEGLSKRTGALSIAKLREAGFEPMAIACLAALIGTSENVVAYNNMDELAQNFDIKYCSKSSAKFSVDDLVRLNRSLLLQMEYAEIEQRLAKLGIEGEKAREFWYLIRGNIEKFDEVKYWWEIVTRETFLNNSEISAADLEFLATALSVLPQEKFNENSWKSWIEKVKQTTGRKGKDLFIPLRLAITGKEHGPDLSQLLPLLSYDIVAARLKG